MIDVFPYSGWRRVEIDRLRKTKLLLDNLLDMASYLLKYPKEIFRKGTSKGIGRAEHDRLLRQMRASFIGPTMPVQGYAKEFDQDAAIRQWALFTDRMGPMRMSYSVENAYAQKWLSRSETQWVIHREEYEWLHGYQRTEVHRDVGPVDTVVPSHLRQFVPRRRTRALRYDEDWLSKTDLSALDPDHPGGQLVLLR